MCQDNTQVIANTLFHRNQIDYILCSQRWRSSIQSAKTRPGADCGSDHELLIAKFRLKLKKVGITTRPFRYDLNQIPSDYTVKVRNRFKGLVPGSSPSRIQGNPQDERHRRMRERVRQSPGLSLKFIFAWLLYTLNNIFGGSAYCLHTSHLKTLQQLDLQQKLDVTHILFRSQESFLSFGLQAC